MLNINESTNVFVLSIYGKRNWNYFRDDLEWTRMYICYQNGGGDSYYYLDEDIRRAITFKTAYEASVWWHMNKRVVMKDNPNTAFRPHSIALAKITTETDIPLILTGPGETNE